MLVAFFSNYIRNVFQEISLKLGKDHRNRLRTLIISHFLLNEVLLLSSLSHSRSQTTFFKILKLSLKTEMIAVI